MNKKYIKMYRKMYILCTRNTKRKYEQEMSTRNTKNSDKTKTEHEQEISET